MAHDDWVRVLMALHNWDQVRGKALARDWSASGPEKFRDQDFEAAWRSFKPGGGVTLGTVFEMARRHDWRATNNSILRRNARQTPESEPDDVTMSKWPDPPRPEVFYGILGESVRRLKPHTESDAMAKLVQGIVGFGNIIGRTAYFQVEADRHFCNLNAATVGNSSEARKGTSRGHLRRPLRTVDSSWPRYITGSSTGEGLINWVRDPVMEPGKDGG